MPSPKKLRNVHGVVALAIATTACLIIEACSQPADSSAAPAPSSSGETVSVVGRRIDIKATNDGFQPSTISVKKGEQVVLRFTRTTKSECLKAIAIPELGIKKDLPLDAPVEVAIKPEKEGKIGFQCWMAMVKGTIEVGG